MLRLAPTAHPPVVSSSTASSISNSRHQVSSSLGFKMKAKCNRILITLALAILSMSSLTSLSSAAKTLEDLNDYELEILDEFRDTVKHLLYKDFMKSDAYLVRWLNVADFDLHEAVERLKKSLAWRKAYNVDAALSENYTFIDETYPIVVDGMDKDGRPLVMSHVGAFDIRKIAISGEEHMYQRYCVRMFELFEEYMHYLRETSGRNNLTQCTCIYDLSGFNLKQGACFQCLKMLPEMITNYEPNYPDVFYRVYLINTPAVFYNVIRIGQNFMSERSQKAMQVFDFDKGKWTEALLKQIPAEDLPTQYGGTKQLKLDKSSIVKNQGLAKIIRARAEAVKHAHAHTVETTTTHGDVEVALAAKDTSDSKEVDPLKIEDKDHGHIDLFEETTTSVPATSTATTTTTEAPTLLSKLRHQPHHHHYQKFIGAKDRDDAPGVPVKSDERNDGVSVKHQFYHQDQPRAIDGHEEVLSELVSVKSASSYRTIRSCVTLEVVQLGILYMMMNTLQLL